MPKEKYSLQFKKDAVALYEDNLDLSLASAARDLGINRSTLYAWVQKFGTGKRTHVSQQQKQARQMSHAEEVRQLKKENRRLREERDILSPRLLNILRKRQTGDPLPVC